MIDRLNPRLCFDALYRQAEFRLRDFGSLRHVMSTAWRMSLTPESKKLQIERERDIAWQEDLKRRVIPWQDVQQQTIGPDAAEKLGVDWCAVPTINTGSRLSGARLIDAVMKDYPKRLINDRGEELRVAELSQRDRYLPLLMAGLRHPGYEVTDTLEEIRKRHEWRGPIVFVPTQLFTGLIRIKLKHDEMSNAECAALPPLESVMCLRGPATGSHENFREMMVVWFSTEYGIDPEVIKFIQQLDWEANSMTSSY